MTKKRKNLFNVDGVLDDLVDALLRRLVHDVRVEKAGEVAMKSLISKHITSEKLDEPRDELI